MGIGCPKDPYRAAIKGSDDVSNGVHSAVVAIGKLYSQGVADDNYKAGASFYLNVITDCNMGFRKSVVDAHKSGAIGAQSYLPLADAFVSCGRRVVPPKGPGQNYLQAVDTSINAIELAVASSKGGKP